MSIKIIEASINSTIQDLGRKNYANLGIARAGVMDEYSFKLANILLGNLQNEAALELCLKGGKYEFLDKHYFVLSGACFDASLNGKSIKTCKVYEAEKGSILELKTPKIGFRGYLSLAGGFKIDTFLNSKASDERMNVGLYGGRNLQKGDILPAKQGFKPFNIEARECVNPINNMPKNLEIRVVLGTNEDSFTQNGINTFLTSNYKISSKSDRMAIHAEGENKIEHKNQADIISAPTVFGSIQVPKSGYPIILMANRQSTGGYSIVATVIENDLALLAQAKIGSSFKFKAISIQEAIALYKKREKELLELDKKINLDFENLI